MEGISTGVACQASYSTPAEIAYTNIKGVGALFFLRPFLFFHAAALVYPGDLKVIREFKSVLLN